MIKTTQRKMYEWTPHSYQERAVQWVLDGFERERCSALFLDPGLGKTTITLEVFRQLKAAGKAKRMLVLAPLRVVQMAWPSELRKWLNFMGMRYVVVHGKDKERLIKQDADIYLINYEAIPWLVEQRWSGADMLVFDELSKMKSWSSKRAKDIKPFLPAFKYRLGLTGTPMTNGLEDLFAQTYMLDLGRRLGKAITRYRAIYFQPPGKYGFKLEPLPGAPALVFDKLKDLAFRINAEDYLTLPSEVHNVIPLELPDALRAKYNELKKETIVALENSKIITAVNKAALTAKLRQFLSGSIYGENREVSMIHSLKYDALDVLIEELNGKPLFVGYYYQHELSYFKSKYPEAEFIADKSSSKLLDLQDRWNAGKVPIMFGHPASVAHGLNFQENCNNICFTSLDFNLDNYLQFIKRIARQGQKEESVFIHYLIFERTIDEYIQAVLANKGEFQTSLLDFLELEEAK